MQNQAIGVFDSGIGGLTLARALKIALPEEQLIYFGDTAHLPYGDKSTAALQAYVIKALDFFLKQKVKCVLIACNSASAAAYELAKEYTASRAKVFNVIDPTVNYIAKHSEKIHIGLIGTRQTVNSGVYNEKLSRLAPQMQLHSLATPLLAPMIEDGFFNNQISRSVIREYLSSPKLKAIEALVLACTHYPLIQKEIEDFYKHQIPVIDSAGLVAEEVKTYLNQNQLLREAPSVSDKFYVSDFTPAFEATTRIFFAKKVKLKLYKLWE
ncbi:MAG: glutamate racemase [Bernardetiaceae bacterium]|nr:glutamate racemase [Bernardetiaceae bacterium]